MPISLRSKMSRIPLRVEELERIDAPNVFFCPISDIGGGNGRTR